MCPIYEYFCKRCNKLFEVIHKIDSPLSKCPTCSDNTVEKQISAGGFILKGEGFYKPSGD